MNKYKWTPLALALAMSASLSNATSNPSGDVDIDNDGLIEIATLQELDLMRYDPIGASLNGDSTGCPVTGCNGYELVADLDFDTNGNGVADAGDLFWNNGEGWLTGSELNGADFNGNGFKIRNLYINRLENEVGLFSRVIDSNIEKLVFIDAVINTGNGSSKHSFGILAGYLEDSIVKNIEIDTSLIMYGSSIDKMGLLIGAVNATVINGVVVENIDVTGEILPLSLKWGDYMGGVIGYASSYITDSIFINNVTVNVVLDGSDDIGGVVGWARQVAIDEADVVIDAKVSQQDGGGIIGQAYSSSISDARVAGTLAGGHISANTGGIAGRFESSSMTRSSFVGTSYIGSDRGGSGGLLGMAVGVNITDSFAIADIGGNTRAGGLIGLIHLGEGYSDSFIARSYSASIVSGAVAEGGLIGQAINYYNDITEADIASTVVSSYWDTDVSGLSYSVGGEERTTLGLQCPTAPGDVSCDPTLFADWDTTVWDFGTSSDYPRLIIDRDNDSIRDEIDVDDNNNGLIEIATLQELDLMRYDPTGASLNGDSTGCPVTGCIGYELVADLDFDTNGNGVADAGDLFWNNGEGWLTGSELNGADFNGNGFKIRNLYINRLENEVGLFSRVIDSNIEKLVFIDAVINTGNGSSKHSFGILAGYLEDSIVKNIEIDTSLIMYGSSIDKMGLLIGAVNATVINGVVVENIDVTGEILPLSLKWGDYMGGVIGYASSYITDSIFINNVTVNVVLDGSDDIGGVVGWARQVAIDEADVVIDAKVSQQDGGGIIGQAYSSSISDARVAGTLAGGHISANTGGIAGRFESSSMTRSSFVGTSYIGSDRGGSGGLLGMAVGVNITDSFAIADIGGNTRAGGLIGLIHLGEGYSDSFIARSYSASIVSGAVAEGGLIGQAINYYNDITEADIASTVVSSYWDTDVSGLSYSVGGEERTTLGLQCPTAPGDVSCDPTLFADWDTTVWDFGTSADYPVLR
jgi:hypothetical protein